MISSLKLALKALRQNKLQALLTLLGMSVGVAMVVIVSGLGRGAQLRIESQIEAAGPTQITLRSGNPTPAAIASGGQQDSSGGEPSEGAVSAEVGGEMADAAEDEASSDARRRIRAVKQTRYRTPATPLGAPEMTLLRGETEGVRAVAASVQGNLNLDANPGMTLRSLRVSGFESAWPEIRGWKLLEGRLVDDDEHEDGAGVMLITPGVAKRLWPNAPSPLDQTVNVGGQQVRVVGVIDETGDSSGEMVVPLVYLPLKLAQSLLHRDTYDTITVRTTSVGVTTSVAKDMKARIRQLHQLPDDMLDDFRVETQSVSAMPSMGLDPRLARAVHSNVVGFEQAAWEEMAKSLRQAGQTFTLLLAGAAAVSLLVGGVGVMNIMLVSVTARTREIGLRMALGARAKDVMLQFVIEAVTLAALGGLIGLVLGAVGLAIAKHGLHWATAISPTMLVVALLMAGLTGIAFGFGPARRAAALDPVIALRSE